MHQLPIEQQILLVAQIVALVALCARMWWDGLYKIYSLFLWILGSGVAADADPVVCAA